MEKIISDAQKVIETNPTDMDSLAAIVMTQYKYSMCIRGDNVVDHAKYLGYLDGKELYPDVEITGLKKLMSEMLAGEFKPLYSS